MSLHDEILNKIRCFELDRNTEAEWLIIDYNTLMKLKNDHNRDFIHSYESKESSPARYAGLFVAIAEINSNEKIIKVK